jgi:hypothetical protein
MKLQFQPDCRTHKVACQPNCNNKLLASQILSLLVAIQAETAIAQETTELTTQTLSLSAGTQLNLELAETEQGPLLDFHLGLSTGYVQINSNDGSSTSLNPWTVEAGAHGNIILPNLTISIGTEANLTAVPQQSSASYFFHAGELNLNLIGNWWHLGFNNLFTQENIFTETSFVAGLNNPALGTISGIIYLGPSHMGEIHEQFGEANHDHSTESGETHQHRNQRLYFLCLNPGNQAQVCGGGNNQNLIFSLTIPFDLGTGHDHNHDHAEPSGHIHPPHLHPNF